ncbi:hypothetical protein [Streptomyces sp. NPDC002889]|uniref:hypothetical protein n=1 Tax=Streptomyces sp. NPDC002889 TaxID=3364669 RepID=UPI0036CCCCEE
MPAEQFGRWSGAATTALAQDAAAQLAPACTLHAVNEISNGVEPDPAAAVLARR